MAGWLGTEATEARDTEVCSYGYVIRTWGGGRYVVLVRHGTQNQSSHFGPNRGQLSGEKHSIGPRQGFLCLAMVLFSFMFRIHILTFCHVMG